MTHPRPFYYLDNFKLLLDGLVQRYQDLLNDGERCFIETFAGLPQCAQALLVRMIMRKGVLFRGSKLRYVEIPDVAAAAEPLTAIAWVDGAAVLSIGELCRLLRKPELIDCFDLAATHRHARKSVLHEFLATQHADARPLGEWYVKCIDVVYRVAVAELCEQLRLLFFGNYRQDLSEFVLSDLGIFKYEAIELGHHARAFDSRAHIDAFFALYRSRQALRQWNATGLRDVAELKAISTAMPSGITGSEWLEDRRQRLRFDVARELERSGEVEAAVEVYADCQDPRAAQRLARIANRHLKRRPRRALRPIPMIDMIVVPPMPVCRVEYVVLEELVQHSGGAAPVHYVENTLVNALFGLLCWRAIFAPVPGAFFHAFHHGPADLGSARFRERRAQIFDECLAELDNGSHRHTIVATYRAKMNTVSPFVFWGALDEQLLTLALDCIPAADLKVWFEWILNDIKNNRTGFPDLIQFWPDERRYALIEVKGPGDRLQDNQRRCLEHCLAHRVPVSVVRVQWAAIA